MSYIRDVKYYETDQMAIVHHSNYIRWFEEARMEFLNSIGYPYDKMEEMGILSPVLGVSCQYKIAIKFGEKVAIDTKVLSFDGIRLKIGYELRNLATNKITSTGESDHCFVTRDFKPINMKKQHRDFYDELMKHCVETK